MGELRACILVVDDERAITRVVRRALESDFNVLEAHNATEMYELLDQGYPVAVAIVEPRLYDLEGRPLIEALREFFPDVVRLAWVGTHREETLIRALDQGDVYCFLRKPFELGELRAHVNAAVWLHLLQVSTATA